MEAWLELLVLAAVSWPFAHLADPALACHSCVRESHRDAGRFEDPEAFDPDRFLDPPSAGSYVPFGTSQHACLGQYLTLAFGRIFVEELAGGFEWEVVEDGPREYGGFHWRPSSKLSLILDPRSRP